MKLQQYNFTIKHRSGKINSNADALSRIPEEEIYCFMLEQEYESDSENEAECSQKKQKLQNENPDQYLTNSQGIHVGHFNIQELDRTGSQYLANLGFTPGESEEEQELSTFYQENFQYRYSSDNDLTWDNHYTDSYENSNEMTIEKIREDGSSVVLSIYNKEADATTIL